MNSITSQVTDGGKFGCYIERMNHFSETLKIWRKARRLSQLDLALEADVSARHISFLETGRANPSREMIDSAVSSVKITLRFPGFPALIRVAQDVWIAGAAQ